MAGAFDVRSFRVPLDPEEEGEVSLPKDFRAAGEKVGEPVPVVVVESDGCIGAEETRVGGLADGGVGGRGDGDDGPGLSPNRPSSLSVTGALRTRSVVLGLAIAGTGGGGEGPAFCPVDADDVDDGSAEGTEGTFVGIFIEGNGFLLFPGELDGASDRPANKSLPFPPDMISCLGKSTTVQPKNVRSYNPTQVLYCTYTGCISSLCQSTNDWIKFQTICSPESTGFYKYQNADIKSTSGFVALVAVLDIVNGSKCFPLGCGE